MKKSIPITHHLKLVIDQHKLYLAVICLGIFVTYWGVWNYDLVWDDRYFILHWEVIRDPIANLGSIIRSDVPVGQGTVYRPIRSLLYSLSFLFWGENPTGYNLQILFSHIITSCLVFLILQKIIKNKPISLLGALIFGLHPIQVEVATWITAGFDAFGYLAYFASLYIYIVSRHLKRNSYLIVSYSLAGIAFFTSELTLTLPFIIILYELLIRNSSLKELHSQSHIHKPYWIILVAFMLARYLFMPEGVILERLTSGLIASLTLSSILFIQYLRLIVYPSLHTINHTLWDSVTAFSRDDGVSLLFSTTQWIWIIIPISIILALLIIRQHKPTLTFAVLGILTSLSPVLQFLPTYTLFGERYVYIALFFFILLLSMVIKSLLFMLQLKLDNKSPILIVLVIPIVILGYHTRQQHKVWQSDLSLWQHAYTHTPQSAKANNNLGLAYYRDGNYSDGIFHLEKSVGLNPGNLQFQFSLANAYLEQDKDDDFVDQMLSMQSEWDSQREHCQAVNHILIQYNKSDLLELATDNSCIQ